MPDEIIVASCRVITVSSCALTRFGPSEMSILRPDFFSSMRHDAEAAALQLLGDRLARHAVEHARLGRAGEVDGLEREGAHYAAIPMSPPMRPDSTSLRSSSGFEDRVSAIAIVILPARTRPASEVSMVCMPCAPPVWMSE